MHLTTTGIVLREVNYKESDKILTILTRDAGKMTVNARGCRRKNSAIAAVSQQLCYSEFTLYEYRGRWGIREGELLREFRGVRTDLEKLCLGAWFAELTEALTVEEVESPEILRLLLNSLYALEELNKPAAQVKAAFELKMMALAGYEPMVLGCGVCGREPDQPRFHLAQGTLHCPECRGKLGQGVSLPLDAQAVAAMRYVLYGEEKRLFSFRIPQKSLELMGAATEAFALTQLERGFRTLDFYKQLSLAENRI